MGRKQGPRKGSMQFWPRKRAEKILPRVNWKPVISTLSGSHPLSSSKSSASSQHSSSQSSSISSHSSGSSQPSSGSHVLGFIGYKAGMASAYVKDNTPDYMTKNKRIIVPVTILECPPMKILSVRFYKNGRVFKEVLNDNLDKELIRIVKIPSSKNKRSAKDEIEKIVGSSEKEKSFDDVQIMVYSEAKRTEIKKTPDISEMALSGGNVEEKINFIKDHLAKEISVNDVFSKGVVDIRGVTTGRGFQGSVKRFGIRLRFHKSEKGVRRVGSVGAWHPTGIRFRVPMPGQIGFHTRLVYNSPVIASKKFSENDMIAKKVFSGFGIIKTDYIILAGSVQGPVKRQLLITHAFRPTKKQIKRQYELLELR